MNGYCGDCDKQIEFHQGTVQHVYTSDGNINIYLVCPWCDEEELVTVIER